MSILDFMEPCALILKLPESWTLGTEFLAAIAPLASKESPFAGGENALSTFNVLAPKNLNLNYNDCFVKIASQEYFRIASCPSDMVVPIPSSNLSDLCLFSAVKIEKPCFEEDCHND